MPNPEFIFMPYEILQDDRLTLRQIKVLMAICSWRKKNTNIARVSRKILCEKTGIRETRISSVTTELSKLGWLEKRGNGGKSQWVEYTLTVPELGTLKSQVEEPERVPETGTVPELGTVPSLGLKGTRIGSQTVPESGTPIDTVTKTVTKTIKETWLLPDWINPSAWDEFEQHRSTVKKSQWNDLARTKAANVLKEFTFEEQQAAVNHSIIGGYPGLYPKKINGAKNETSRSGGQSNHARVLEDLHGRIRESEASERISNDSTVREIGSDIRPQVDEPISEQGCINGG